MDVRKKESDFPFTHLPSLSKQSNFRLRPMNWPTKSPVGPVLIGDGDLAAFHTKKYLGERIIATPRNR